MTKTIRIAGAQMPVTRHAAINALEIKKAIDWAAENNVDYLVTPEASLSGYTKNFDDKYNQTSMLLSEIERYAAEKHVGLCLGTLWNELESDDKIVCRNQIRFYDPNGKFLGPRNKHYTIEYDNDVGVVGDNRKYLIPLPVGDKVIPVGGLICVDMYPLESYEYLPRVYNVIGARLLIHATNAVRNVAPSNGLSTEISDSIANAWHDVNLRRASFFGKRPIITVDNCYMLDGTEYHGPTASESGVLINGEWVTKVPRTGTQYFYYDLPIENLIVDAPKPQ
jgi:predicted amidohydrolase